MIFTPTDLPGLYTVRRSVFTDERGYFGRTHCAEEFEKAGLEGRFVQDSISYNARKGTLRGMHFQVHPYEEIKLVTCLTGAIYDVAVDLRKDSPTYCRWQAFELSEANETALYIPKGFAHGFQTLTDDARVYYKMSTFFTPGSYAGVRYDDPAFAIEWPPAEKRVISDKDQRYEAFIP